MVQQSQRPAFSEMESSEQQRHELVAGEGEGEVGYKKVGRSGLGAGQVHELDAGGVR